MLRVEPEEVIMSQQHVVAAESRGVVDHQQPQQLSRGGIVRVWAAAAGPMAVLSWLVAPLLATRLTGPAAWPQALLVCLTAGLVWQGVLVLVLVRRELGSLRWSAVQDALWLHRPRSPRTRTTPSSTTGPASRRAKASSSTSWPSASRPR